MVSALRSPHGGRAMRLLVLAALLVSGYCRDHPFSFQNLGNRNAARARTNELDALLTRNNAQELRTSFGDFKDVFTRAYASSTEEDTRYNNYVTNLQKIAKANKDTTRTYWLGVNEFSDMSDAEIRASMLMTSLPPDVTQARPGRKLTDSAPKMATPADIVHLSPAQRKLQQSGIVVDWRTAGGVTPVKNQGSCGSCWAFAATAAIESAYLLSYGVTADLSEQQLLSCSGAGTCGGGGSSNAMSYVITNNQTIESAFPYTHTDAACSAAIRSNPVVSLSGSIKAVPKKSAAALRAAVTRQPVVTYFQVDPGFASVAGGIYNGPCVDTTINHAMLVVGYGYDTVTGAGYWIVKNSWGTNWGGNGGYIYVAMTNDGSNGLCAMYTWALWYVDMTTTGKGFDITLAPPVTCTAGNYKDPSGTCVPCSGGASSPAGATSETQCICPLGGSAYYKSKTGCVTCTAPTTSGSSTDGRACNCASGYNNFNANTGTCSLGPCSAGTYKDASSGTCAACSGGASSPNGATSETQCFCPLGGTAYYKAATGCVTCTAPTTTGFSTNGKACNCAAGYNNFNSGTGTCTGGPCSAGTYKDASGTCVACSGGASSPDGATSETQCFCLGGTTYYKAKTGCMTCTTPTTLGTSADGKACSCAAGFPTFNSADGTCSAQGCVAGTYLSPDGLSCTSCALSPLTKYAATSPASSTSESACYCRVNRFNFFYYKPATGCTTCGSGTTGKSADGRTCPCATGYQNFDANLSTCSSFTCTNGQYVSGNTCLSCPNGDQSPDGKNCPCPTGFNWDNTTSPGTCKAVCSSRGTSCSSSSQCCSKFCRNNGRCF